MKPLCVIQSPLATRSGYGDAARDLARHVIELDQFDVILVSMPWGTTPMNALNPTDPRDKMLLDRISPIPVNLPRQPELFIQVSVPNEFQPIGKYNIGFTAGIETNACSGEWLEGCNRMDLILAMSEHSKFVFQNTTSEMRNQMGQTVKTIKLEKPIEVLHNCVDLSIFRELKASELEKSVTETLSTVKENFVFLFVGHWLQGSLGQDRKNVGMLVHTFCDAFKDTATDKRPALMLKTSGAGFSIMDQQEILRKITEVRNMIGPNAPAVYLLHGELTEKEMSSLYNHPKVKVHVSFTKGEGFGRPLLEATLSKKPVMASGWSGHLDFLNPEDSILLSGGLTKVDQSVVWQNVIIPESSWFTPDYANARAALQHVFKYYDKFIPGAERLYKKNKEAFSYNAIKEKTATLFAQYVPTFEMAAPLSLPKLKKFTPV